MEISGKVLREVEFRDRLRGYDTDEVDEFLEKVAIAIDDGRSEIAMLRERAERAEQRGELAPVAVPVPDDDAIRRTLVLAQRTADLAISEAREEAIQLVDDARAEAESAVTQAKEMARRVRDEADLEATERLGRLAEQRDQLEREIQSLAHLLQGERDRLSQSLQSALRFVDETLAISEDMSTVASRVGAPASPPLASSPPPVSSPPVSSSSPSHPDDLGMDPPSSSPMLMLPDIEAEISEDAATAFAGEPPPGTEYRRVEEPLVVRSEPQDEMDPDEALWARWAQGAGIETSEGDEGPDQFPFNHPGGPSSA